MANEHTTNEKLSLTSPDAISPLTRRGVLGLGASLVAGLMGGCRVQTKPNPVSSESVGGSRFTINFPEPRTSLPSESVTYRTMLSGGGPIGGWADVFGAFHKEHPHITIDNPETTWDTINEAVTLGVRNGSAPDLFSLPIAVPMQAAVNAGWAAPLDDIIPDFDTWKSKFPETAFIPGLHIFNGKTYSWSWTSNFGYAFYTFYDKGLMAKAEYDPQSQPLTFETLRMLAKKITDQGKGEVFGLMAAGSRLGGTALAFAERAGLSGGEMNFKTGEYQQGHPILVEAVELLLAMKSDRSIVPGVLSLSQDVAIARMALGKTGMTFEGNWVIGKWEKDNPTFDCGVAMPPTGDDKTFHHASFVEGTAAPVIAYAKSKFPTITGELLSYIGSVDGQVAMIMGANGALSSQIPDANEKAASVGRFPAPVMACRGLAEKLLVRQPVPQFVNPDVGQVILQQKPVKPILDDIVQGVFSGQVENIGKALSTLQNQSNKSLDDAIAAARKKGVEVSRDDYKFSNWDPEKDYTFRDYQGR